MSQSSAKKHKAKNLRRRKARELQRRGWEAQEIKDKQEQRSAKLNPRKIKR